MTYYNVLDKLDIEVSVSENPLELDLHHLFQMGARINPKRNFLFISKLLGKHLDVHPDIPKAAGHLLASLFLEQQEKKTMESIEQLVSFIQQPWAVGNINNVLNKQYALSEPTLFIGFAETATGLGHAVFSAFSNAHYIHTTREEITTIPSVFDFKEEHSHAVDHSCYLKDASILDQVTRIVLIDDEMTTGKTSLNLIRSLHKTYPEKNYTILSLLDWRKKEEQEQYQQTEKELGISIDVASLIKGTIELKKNGTFTYEEEKPSKVYEIKENISYRLYDEKPILTARTGISSKDQKEIEKQAKEMGERLKKHRQFDDTLVVGMGEFMYVPSRIAANMGKGIHFKTTTRSPIFIHKEENYPIHDRILFQDGQDITYHLYNLLDKPYQEVLFLLEKKEIHHVMHKIATCFYEKGIKNVTFIRI
jgi:hypoxanthine-guanine phosphoribosyltransferase